MNRLATIGVAAAVLVLLSQPAFAAIPVVKTVPWVASNPLIPHDTWTGKSIRLKGTCDQQGANFHWTWDFGDGSPVATGTVSNMFVVEASHTYTGATGTVFTATLTIQDTSIPTPNTGSAKYYVAMRDKTQAVEVNVAIDEGLWYLHKDMRRFSSGGLDKGDWVSGSAGGYASQSYVGNTAINLNAFFVDGHLETGDAGNPYTETVQRGMRRLFEGVQHFGISNETYPAPIGTVSPDTNGNGFALQVYYGPNGFDGTYPPYQGGMVMDAIVASGTPDRITTTGEATYVISRKYKDIVQDLVDAYAYGQGESGTYYGGWRYGWDYGCSACNTDNSTNQWAAIGLLAASKVYDNGPDGILGTADDLHWATVPSWVRQANINSINTTQATTGSYIGSFYYSPTDYGTSWPWGMWATTPSGMVQMAMDGIGRGDARWDRTENFLRNNFCNSGGAGGAIRAYYYGLFSFTKSMLLHDSNGDGIPEPITLLSNQPGSTGGIDWYAVEGSPCDGVARTLLNTQNASGYWYGHSYTGQHYYFETGWAIIMLNRTVFQSGVPVAVATAFPNPAVAGQTINLSGAASFDQDPTKTIVAWVWDLDNNGTFETSGVTATVSFPAVGNYPVKLRVTDSAGQTADTVLTIQVSTPPLAPSANPGGPYNFCVGRNWFLDGSGSVNPDNGQHEPGPYPGDYIKLYAWDLNGDLVFTDALGVNPSVTGFWAPGSYVISLKVTDNTSLSFPSSGFGDLSGVASTQVIVRSAGDPLCACVTNLAARAKPGKADLTWTWQAGTHHYNVYRGTADGGPYLKIGTVSAPGLPNTGVYADSGLTNGMTYYWIVRQANAADAELCQSNQASARPTAR